MKTNLLHHFWQQVRAFLLALAFIFYFTTYTIAQSNFHFNIGPEWTYLRSTSVLVLDVESWRTNHAICMGLGFEKDLSKSFRLGVMTEMTTKYQTKHVQTNIIPFDLFVYRFMRLNFSGIYHYRNFEFGIGPTFCYSPKIYQDISSKRIKDQEGFPFKEIGFSEAITWNYKSFSFGFRGYWGTSIYFEQTYWDIFKPFRSIGISAGYRIYNSRGKR